MKIILLGGTGYLGSKICKKLVENGHEVLCLKRKNSNTNRLSEVFEKVEFCNIEDLQEFLENRTEKYDCFCNTACRYLKNEFSDAEVWESNLQVPLKCFLTCMDYGVRRYLTIGTGLPNDFNVYCMAKYMYAEIGKWYSGREGGMEFCNVELENFYGEDEPKNRFIPGTIEALKRNEKILLTTGTQKRDYIYAGDVVKVVVWLLEKEVLPQYIDLPVGTGEGISVREVISYLKEITNSKSELCFGAIPKRVGDPNSIADCEKLCELGFDTEKLCSWRDGLKKLI